MLKRYTSALPSVKWLGDVPFDVWYVENFPLDRLRYRDLYALDPNGRQWRQMLLDDIRERGIRGGPFLVYNHQHNDPELRDVINKPFYLRVGRNRRWALKELGYTHAPCIVTGGLDANMDGVRVTAETMGAYVTDGEWEVSKHGITVRNKADASNYEYPR